MRKVIQKYKAYIVLSIISSFIISCSSQKEVKMSQNKIADIATGDGKQIITVPIVSKSFVKKNGEVTEYQELYIRRSIKDYYIKFCESNITRKELENKISNFDEFNKVVTVEVQFLNGYRDICDGNLNQQSRMGEYVIIHKIL